MFLFICVIPGLFFIAALSLLVKSEKGAARRDKKAANVAMKISRHNEYRHKL